MPGKKHIIFIGLFAWMLLGSCKTKLTRFHIDYHNEVLSRSVGSGNLVSFSTEEIKSNCRVKFEKNDTKRSKVKRIWLKSLGFYNGSDQGSVNHVKKLKNIYISSPNYAEQKINFKIAKSNETVSGLVFELTASQELINFIKQDRFSMRFDFENTEKFPESMNLYADIEFFVEGELIKTNLYHKILV